MQKGDLSNHVAPRLVFVYEGLLASEPVGVDRIKVTAAAKLRRWERVAALWNIDGRMAQQLWDIVWRHGFRFDIVTYLYRPEFAVALFRHLDAAYPISNVMWFESPQSLARQLAYMPDVAIVYDGDLGRSLAYGSKGKNITNPSLSLL